MGYTSLADEDAAFVLSIDVDDEEIARDSVERITGGGRGRGDRARSTTG